MRFRQHMPGFCDFEPYDINVDSIKELLDRPEIKRLKEMKGHHRFSVSPNKGEWSKSLLMHELDDGYTWFVVGYLDMSPKETGLPIWEAKYTEEEKRNRAQPVKYISQTNTSFYKAAASVFDDCLSKINADILNYPEKR